MIGVIFFIYRLIDFVITIFSSFFIPYLGFFPYKEILDKYNLPRFLSSLANFDGVHYLLIAKNGYTTYEQAFFPLYPILIKLFWPHAYITNYLFGFVNSLIISNLSFLIGLYIFAKYLNVILGSANDSRIDSGRVRSSLARMTKISIWPIIFLLLFPTSFFFGIIYTEGLFFLLFIGTLYFLKKEKYYIAAFFAFLASLTRFIGVFLIIPILISQISRLKNKKNWKLEIGNWKFLLTLLSPLLGLGLYCTYLWKVHHDPFFFLSSQWAFGAHRTSRIILLPQVYYRYIMIFLTAKWNFQYFISLFEFVTFSFVFVILILDFIRNWKLKIRNYERLGLNLFSFVNLILPTLTGTFSSIPRYALFSISFFLYLSQIQNKSLKIAIAIVFGVLHIIMLSFFMQGYFVS